VSKTIAIGGKGGTGKTTIAALLIMHLARKGIVLAVDGDPSSNLHLDLGLSLESSIGSVREGTLAKVKKGELGVGVSKPQYIELEIREALVESERIDLLAMGRTEGPGCYCAVNSLLRSSIDRLARNYDYVVIDNEAGMEHISRQTARDIDMLLIISNLSMMGIVTACRMRDLISELRTHVGRIALVLNQARPPIPPPIERAITESHLELIGLLPVDSGVEELEVEGLPLSHLAPDSPLRLRVVDMAERLGL
jgi:CO dehydrogenase maturation factor